MSQSNAEIEKVLGATRLTNAAQVLVGKEACGAGEGLAIVSGGIAAK